MAAFQTLLHRYTGQEDFSVGTPIAGRNHQELEPLIGFFVNTLVVRSRLSSSLTFRELVGRVREVALGVYAHQDVPFEKLVEELQPKRDLSRAPLFQVMFSVVSTPEAELTFPGMAVRPFEAGGSTISKFDLTVSFAKTAEGFGLGIEYNTDLFAPATIARMTGHLRMLLEGAVANPGARLSELPLLSAAERRQVLVEWNDTRTDFPTEACVHHLFEAQVARTPEATALALKGRTLTFRELDTQANRLAHHLRTLGVGREVRVGLCLERSLELVVGVLGILKAGGAYVPMDPSYPVERLAFMARDAAVPVLVTRQALAALLPAQGELRVCVDSDAEARSSRDTPLRQAWSQATWPTSCTRPAPPAGPRASWWSTGAW